MSKKEEEEDEGSEDTAAGYMMIRKQCVCALAQFAPAKHRNFCF